MLFSPDSEPRRRAQRDEGIAKDLSIDFATPRAALRRLGRKANAPLPADRALFDASSPSTSRGGRGPPSSASPSRDSAGRPATAMRMKKQPAPVIYGTAADPSASSSAADFFSPPRSSLTSAGGDRGASSSYSVGGLSSFHSPSLGRTLGGSSSLASAAVLSNHRYTSLRVGGSAAGGAASLSPQSSLYIRNSGGDGSTCTTTPSPAARGAHGSHSHPLLLSIERDGGDGSSASSFDDDAVVIGHRSGGGGGILCEEIDVDGRRAMSPSSSPPLCRTFTRARLSGEEAAAGVEVTVAERDSEKDALRGAVSGEVSTPSPSHHADSSRVRMTDLYTGVVSSPPAPRLSNRGGFHGGPRPPPPSCPRPPSAGAGVGVEPRQPSVGSSSASGGPPAGTFVRTFVPRPPPPRQ